MEDKIILGKNVYLHQISEKEYFVFNSANKKSYEIGKEEYETLLTMREEHSFDELYKINQNRMNIDKFREFCTCVGKMGFLKGTEAEKKFQLTKIKKGLFNPSSLWDKNSAFIKFMHFALTKMPIIAVVFGLSTFLYSRNNNNLLQTISNFDMSSGNVIFSIIMIFLITSIHELGHTCMGIYYGVPIPEIGIMLYWFTPCAYADVSAIHFIKDKSKQIQVLMAGIYTHIIWVGLGIAAFNLLPDLVDYTIPFTVINLGLIFINVTFYLKLDGYHVLSILFDEPLLREHSMGMVLRKEVRDRINEECNYSERLAYCLIAFVSLLYIPALFMSGILRVLPIIINMFVS